MDVENYKYIGRVDNEQLNWLSDDLKKIRAETPVVAMTHIPLLTAYHDLNPPKQGYLSAPPVTNRNAVLEKFKNYNLKLVLQGHIHWFEDLNIANKTRFITSGAVSGRPTWQGNNHGQKGFSKVQC